MSQLANVLVDIAQQAYCYADHTAFDLVPGRAPTDEEMNERRDGVRRISIEMAALAEQAQCRQVQTSEIETLMAQLGQLGFLPTGDQFLGLEEALKEQR